MRTAYRWINSTSTDEKQRGSRRKVKIIAAHRQFMVEQIEQNPLVALKNAYGFLEMTSEALTLSGIYAS